ncbi:MAG: hypothetical protein JNL58_08190 [Planctomyces sp.]|nr:hypothetical protein [Planctomyces sp.]
MLRDILLCALAVSVGWLWLELKSVRRQLCGQSCSGDARRVKRVLVTGEPPEAFRRSIRNDI